MAWTRSPRKSMWWSTKLQLDVLVRELTWSFLPRVPRRIEQAAKEANAHDFISEFEEKYDTQVGEKGNQLSGGQVWSSERVGRFGFPYF